MTKAVSKASPVLVVADPDAEIRDTVTGFMSARGYHVERAADIDAATGLLSARKVDVLISDLAMRGNGGADLLSVARAAAPATRTIAIAADLTPRERDAALRLGAVRVLAKPLSLLELADAITLAHDCADGFHGWMHRMSQLDGSIAFHRGELIHAECHGHTGMSALIELLTAQRGRLETSALTDTIRTIAGPFDHVLLDGLRSLDESRGSPTIAPASLDGWFDELIERDPLDRQALTRWLGEHAPGAGVWRIQPETGAVERLDVLGTHPEHEVAGTPGSLGWAYELAELADPSWTRVELTSGAMAVALIRVPGVVLALARLVSGEAVQRRFQVESAQLVRWLLANTAGAR
jgi:DNA-binding response OmpR family regulator